MATKGVVATADYTFNKTAQTITFSANYTGIALSDILYITNVVSGVATVIYDPSDAAKGGSLAGLVLTLAYNTAAMNNADPLQVIVGMNSLPATLPTNAAQETGGNLAALVANLNDANQSTVSLDDMAIMLRRALQLMERPTYVTPIGELKVVNGSSVFAASVATVTTVTNAGAMVIDQSNVYYGQNRQLFNQYLSRIIS